MKPPEKMIRIIAGKRYSVETAALIAHDCYWDGQNFERHGRNTYLYRTPHGRYFTVNLTQWQGERDTLTPISQVDAIALYEGVLPEHEAEYGDAFPDVTVEDA